MATSMLYYGPARPSAFSTLPKLQAGAVGRKDTLKSVDAIRAWLEKQEAYTLHRPVRKRFARSPYCVTYVMDVWECDLTEVQAYAKYKYHHRYILSVIDVFKKFQHLIPVKKKSGHSVATAFRSLFVCPRRPVWVQTDKGKDLLNKHFQDMLRDEGKQF